MTNRRQFLTTVSAVAGSLAAKERLEARSTAPRVEAAATVFYAPPDGLRTLVRFTVTGVDAPAGRLRAFDRGRLLGTAGVLARGEALVGELWLPLPRDSRITTQFEAPGLGSPLRTAHQLVPQRRWTIHVVSVVDPRAVTEELDALPPIRRGVRTAMLLRQGVTCNPIPPSADSDHLDHLALLRIAAAAQDAELRYGVPVSRIAVAPEGRSFPRTLAGALAGSGVSSLALTPPDLTRPELWEAWEDARVLAVPLAPFSDPASLGFRAPLDEMADAVERWLTTTPLFLSPAYPHGVAVAVATDVATPLPSIDEWNGKYAYPRIVVGDAAQLLADLSSGSVTVETAPARAVRTRNEDPSAVVVEAAAARERQASERAAQLVAALSKVLASGAGLTEVAAKVRTVTPGTLVLNTSPYSRSELVRMHDGTVQLATNLPALGYAYFPDAASPEEREGRPAWTQVGQSLEIEGGFLGVALDPRTGGIESLVDRTDGRQWVAEDAGGLNAVAGSRLERVIHQRLPGVADRLDVVRWAPGLGTVRTEITVYVDLPWLDIVNDAEAVGRRHIEYGFPFSLPVPRVSWEIPAGYEERLAPVDRLNHLRWLRFSDSRGTVLFRGLDAPWASVDERGRLTSYAPRDRSRFRLAVYGYEPEPDAAWIFGWNAEPPMTAPVTPNEAGPLPRFGSLLRVDPVGVAVLGLLPAEDGSGLILYLQDVIGVGRRVDVQPGLIRFSGGRLVDHLERNTGEELAVSGGRLSVPLPAGGVSVVRILGVELNGG